MSTSITKLAPQAVVLAMAVYWSWPSLKASFFQAPVAAVHADAKNAAGPRDFAGAALSPAFPPLSKRNPFLMPSANPSTTAKSARPAGKNQTAGAATDVPELALALNATCIVGDQRLAIINGRVYREKEAIGLSGNEAANCILTEILPHKVLLSYQGNSIQLNYVNVAAKHPAADSPLKPVK